MTEYSRIVSLGIEQKTGRLYAEMVDGEKHILDIGMPAVTSATMHEGQIVATDGRRIIRTDGRVIEDITERFA